MLAKSPGLAARAHEVQSLRPRQGLDHLCEVHSFGVWGNLGVEGLEVWVLQVQRF